MMDAFNSEIFQDCNSEKEDELFTILSDQTLESDSTTSGDLNKSATNKIKYNGNMFTRNELLGNDSSSHKNQSDQNNGKLIIENFSQTLKAFKEKLNEPLCHNQAEKEMENGSNKKVKFENLVQFKKDVVIKKLLKTIDVMNQELNKRDQLVINLEKENFILNQEKLHNLNKSCINQNSNEHAYFDVEIKRLKQQVANEIDEKEIYKNKIRFLEHQILDIKSTESSFLPDYKEITNNSNVKTSLENSKLIKQNEELSNINLLLKSELDKLQKQVELMEKKQSLESEISERFENTLKHKMILEKENRNLENKVETIKDEMKNHLDQFDEIKTLYENETFELIKKLNQQETRANEKIKFYENQLNESNSNLQTLIESHQKQVNQLEKNLKLLTNENESNKKHIETLNKLSIEQQKQIQKLFYDLEEKNAKVEKQSTKQGDEVKRLRQSLNLSNDKLKYHQMKAESELEEARKKQQKDIDQLKFANEQASVRNGELSRANGELRKKLQIIEGEWKDLSDKYNSNKHNTDILFKQKKELREEMERTSFVFRKEINVLEQQRDEYLSKATHQQHTIDQMIDQISHFQKDLEIIVKQNELLSAKLKKAKSTNEIYRKKNAEVSEFLKKSLQECESLKELRDKEQRQKQLITDQLTQIDLINNLIKELDLNVNFDIMNDSKLTDLE